MEERGGEGRGREGQSEGIGRKGQSEGRGGGQVREREGGSINIWLNMYMYIRTCRSHPS